MELIADAHPNFGFAIEYSALPTETGVLRIYDGNGDETYITPELYWQTPEGLARTRNTLDSNADITVSLWSWCTQLDYYSEAEVLEYLDAMNSLEQDYPDVVFVYMTCNAQADGAQGYNRHLLNEMIRQYCINNDRILFDFADLDCWHNNEFCAYDYDDGETIHTVPIEHHVFHGDEAGHTTYESCEQKGRAFWWMLAMIAGWNAPPTNNTSGTTTVHPTIVDPGPPLGITLLVGLIGVLVVIALLKRAGGR